PIFNCFPTSVEPVKVILRTSGESINTCVISFAEPCSKLTTPLGTPASWKALNTSIAVKGVAEAGFSTTVHPAANAGATFLVIIAIGKFQGVIAPTTPTG